MLLDYMLDKMAWVVEGLIVDSERMLANLEASLGLVHSQTVLSVLLAKAPIQREEAYSLVQRNAMKAWDENRPLIELLKSDPDVIQHLDPDEIDQCFDPTRYLRDAEVVFRRLEAL
jgi:adenylosuccinate lyase